MTQPPFITFEAGEAAMDWAGLLRAFEAGHAAPRAEIGDTFLYRDPDTLLSRAAWIDGLGGLVKTATVFPRNPEAGVPRVNGAVTLFADRTGTLEALVDFHLVTKWKTAGDSLWGAAKLARPDSERILIVGAGTVGRSLWEAYRSHFPRARFAVWNRTPARAQEMAAECPGMRVAPDLERAVGDADIIACATMSTAPVIRGDWLRPGQHLDLIGAYRPDMREVDDTALRRASLFVDSRATTLDHIGELKIPLAEGVITPGDIRADHYDGAAMRRETDEEITLFKNGGGAHLDLMTARYILDAWREAA